MEVLKSIEEINNFIAEEGIRLLYVSRPTCGVCVALKPKIVAMLDEHFPESKIRYVDLEEIPEAAGHLSVFTIPGVIGYVNGKETIREARYLSVDDIGAKVERYYNMLY